MCMEMNKWFENRPTLAVRAEIGPLTGFYCDGSSSVLIVLLSSLWFDCEFHGLVLGMEHFFTVFFCCGKLASDKGQISVNIIRLYLIITLQMTTGNASLAGYPRSALAFSTCAILKYKVDAAFFFNVLLLHPYTEWCDSEIKHHNNNWLVAHAHSAGIRSRCS